LGKVQGDPPGNSFVKGEKKKVKGYHALCNKNHPNTISPNGGGVFTLRETKGKKWPNPWYTPSAKKSPHVDGGQKNPKEVGKGKRENEVV